MDSVMSAEATLTSKGQTTIPKAIRDSLSIKPGDRMTFSLLPDGTVLIRIKNRSALDLAGRLRKQGRKEGRKQVPVERLSR
jgi:AbrB family looped-hinge helix DNA binding protein